MNINESLLRSYISNNFCLIRERESSIKQIDEFLFEMSLLDNKKIKLIQINESKVLEKISAFAKKKFSSFKDFLKNTKEFLLDSEYTPYINYISTALQIYVFYITSNPSKSFIASLAVNSLYTLFIAVEKIIDKLENSKDKKTIENIEKFNNKLKDETKFNDINHYKNELKKLDLSPEGKFVKTKNV